MEQDLTLREALAEDRLDDFVRQEEDRGVVRFAALGELQGKGYGLAGALILEPSAFDHQTREASGADVQAPNGGFRLKRIPQA
jgi:hypothetical protein